MLAAALGTGMMSYYMSSLMSPTDQMGRNDVKNDNMQLWTRNARFHIDDKKVVSVPWGFGLGAFAAAGAQIAGFLSGAQSFKDGMQNVGMSILPDSFLPIPISRIDFTESPKNALMWAMDSVLPSAVRPINEYLMNIDGLGHALTSNMQRKLGEAYLGSDQIGRAHV